MGLVCMFKLAFWIMDAVGFIFDALTNFTSVSLFVVFFTKGEGRY